MRTSCSAPVLFFLLLVLCATAVAQPQPSLSPSEVTAAIVLWNHGATGADSVDQESYAAIAASLGLHTAKLDLRHFDKADPGQPMLLLVPQASSRSLSAGQAQRIVALVNKGLRLVVGGEGPLLPLLHLRLGNPRSVHVVIDRHLPGNNLHWADHPVVRWFADLPEGEARVLYADSASGHPLVVTAELSRGRFIALAPYLDPLSGYGYSRFPTLVNAIVRSLDCRPPFRRQAVDAYFDPGYRFSVSTDSLVAFWKAWGIRAVHASAWYYDETRPYDYKKLVRAAHDNGILVYLWLEWPHVGKGFWDRHPEWRQKNALLEDAKLDWLHLMDLQNPDCLNAALADLSALLKLNWDGIDIAEFTITGAGGAALDGPSNLKGFTSFGLPMRREFEAVAGFDPLELVTPASPHFWQRDSLGLEKFYDYRKAVNNRLLRRVVEFILDLEKQGKRDWELIHTIVDNSLHPEFDRLFGFDLDTTLALVRRCGITLNVEDPYMEWDKPPVRYRRLREWLNSILPEGSSMIDLNIVPFHADTLYAFASSQPTGAEFLQQLHIASERNGRVCVYCEWSVFHQDWPLVPYAMAAGATAREGRNGWEVSTPATVVFNLSGTGTVTDNGRPWPCYGPEGVVLPAGEHHVSFGKTPAGTNSSGQEIRLVAISGELLECKAGAGGFEAIYASPSRCLISLSSSPKRILVDGREGGVTVFKGRSDWMLLAPSGKHRLALFAY
jgi:hypothetical protein